MSFKRSAGARTILCRVGNRRQRRVCGDEGAILVVGNGHRGHIDASNRRTQRPAAQDHDAAAAIELRRHELVGHGANLELQLAANDPDLVAQVAPWEL